MENQIVELPLIQDFKIIHFFILKYQHVCFSISFKFQICKMKCWGLDEMGFGEVWVVWGLIFEGYTVV